MPKFNEKDYWTPHNILTRNAMFNMVIGGRGRGKTFGSLRHCIRHFLKTGGTFIYLRRYESEFKKKGKLLTGVAVKFPDYELRIHGMLLQIRKRSSDDPLPWQTMGYCVQLSTALTEKGVPYDDVDYIIFDEFLVPKGFIRYLPNEVEAFLDFYSTVDRNNDRVRVLFLANSIAIINPYFVYFMLHPRKDTLFVVTKDGYICLQVLSSSDDFTQKVSQSRFGQMISGTNYYDYAVGNEFRDVTDVFIAPKPPSAKHRFTFIFDGKPLAVWSDRKSGFYHITSKPPADAQPYVLTNADMAPDVMMLPKSSPLLKSLLNVYRLSRARFDTVATRELFFDVLAYLNIR